MCRSLALTLENMRATDAVRLQQRSMLREEDHPKERYADWADLIQIYNRSGGRCARCGEPFTPLGTSTFCEDGLDDSGHPQQRDYAPRERAWTPQRIRNFMMHQPSNLEPKPVCLSCNRATMGVEQLRKPFYCQDSGQPSSILTAENYEERYEQGKQWVLTTHDGEAGGPRALFPPDFRPWSKAAQRDTTTTFTCAYPGCGYIKFKRQDIARHVRREARKSHRDESGAVPATVLGADNILYYVSAGGQRTACWTERPREPSDTTRRSSFERRTAGPRANAR